MIMVMTMLMMLKIDDDDDDDDDNDNGEEKECIGRISTTIVKQICTCTTLTLLFLDAPMAELISRPMSSTRAA
jgi:hypothetical protein